MALQLLNVGVAPDDGTGDPLRIAMQKVNANDSELYSLLQLTNAVSAGSSTFIGTKEARITAAIAAAASTGKPVCFIPTYASDGLQLLPYDASLVTFNPAVLMTRESGPGVHLVDVQAYGAAGDGATDNYYSFAAAASFINASADQTGIRTLWVGAGRFLCGKPIWLTAQGCIILGNRQGINTQFLGAFGGGSQIVASHQGGPLFLVANAAEIVQGLVPALVGIGNAFAGIYGQYFDIRDAVAGDLNGLSAFTAECFYKSTYNNAFPAVLLNSGGIIAIGDIDSLCFYLWNVNGQAQAYLTTNISSYVVTGGNIADGNVHHIAISYDGTTLRLFVDGVLVGSTAATGTLKQLPPEQVIVGGRMFNSPDVGLSEGQTGLQGTIDSVRLSNIARYTAGFMPPAIKLASDANTLALLNFDLQVGPMTRMQTKDGDAWLVQRPGAFGLHGFRADGVQFDAFTPVTHIHLQGNSQMWTVEHCVFRRYRYGIGALGNMNKFQWDVRHVAFYALANSSRCGLVTGSTYAGEGTLDTAWFLGGLMPLLLTNAAVRLRNIHIQAGPDTYICAVLNNYNTPSGGYGLDGVETDTEFGAPVLRTPLLVSAPTNPHVMSARNCVFTTVSNVPHVIIDQVSGIDFECCVFAMPGVPAAAVMTTIRAPLGPVVFENCVQVGSFIPWAMPLGTATSVVHGIAALVFSATPAFDARTHDTFELTLTGNVTSSTLINMTPGQPLSFKLKQDGTGGRTFVWPTNVKGAMTISAGANTTSAQEFEVGLDGNAYAVAPGVTGM